MASTRTPRNRKDQPSDGRGKLIALRIAARVCLVLAIFGIVVAGRLVFRKAFFTANPRFTVVDVRIDVLSGTVDPETIAQSLPVRAGRDNLFALDLEAIRGKIMENPMVQQAEVRRVLPGTLFIRLFGRVPMARLLGGGGRLVDEAGLILPPVVKAETAHLPIITGIPDIAGYQVGDLLDTELSQAALQFLRLQATVRHGHWLDVKMIQLGHRYRELRVYLRRNEVCLIAEDAVLVIPARDVEMALDRVLRVIEERAHTNQPTSQVDATSLKVIVRP